MIPGLLPAPGWPGKTQEAELLELDDALLQAL